MNLEFLRRQRKQKATPDKGTTLVPHRSPQLENWVGEYKKTRSQIANDLYWVIIFINKLTTTGSYPNGISRKQWDWRKCDGTSTTRERKRRLWGLAKDQELVLHLNFRKWTTLKRHKALQNRGIPNISELFVLKCSSNLTQIFNGLFLWRFTRRMVGSTW